MQPRSTKIAREKVSLPAFAINVYQRNSMGSYSRQTGTMPQEIILQETKAQHISANRVLVYRVGNSTVMFTGLRKTKFKSWYSGDQCFFQNGMKVKRLLLINFTNDWEGLNIIDFPKTYTTGPALTRFIARVIPHILIQLP